MFDLRRLGPRRHKRGRPQPARRGASAAQRTRLLGYETLENRLLLVGDACSQIACFRFEYTDGSDNPVSSLQAGESYTASLYIRDNRDNASGFIKAYLDLEYSGPVTIDGLITHGPFYSLPGSTSGSTATPGLIDEVGGTDSDVFPPDDANSEFLLFSVDVQANAAGTLSFTPDNADEGSHDIRFFPSTLVMLGEIEFLGGEIEITEVTSPQVSIAATTNGGEAGPTTGTFTVTQSLETSVNTVVSYSVSGTADEGDDYTALPQSRTVTILAGQTTATIDISVINDMLVESEETVFVTLNGINSGDPEVTVDADADEAMLTIIDNDAAQVRLSATTDGNEQGPVSGRFTVTQTAASSTDTTVQYSVSGSADSGDDFTALSGIVMISAGSTSATIDVPVIDDSLLELNETVTLTLTSVESGGLAVTVDEQNDEATLSIADNDTASVSIAATSDGDEEGPTGGRFTVSLDKASPTNTVVTYQATGTATAGNDYQTLSGEVTILAGQTAAVIDVLVVNDEVVEALESVVVTLAEITSGHERITIDAGNDQATVDIADDDSAEVRIETTADGDEDGPASGRFTILQSAEASTDTVVQYTVTGTATSGNDFTSLAGSVTIPAGETSATVDVIVQDDDETEGPETVTITLEAVTGGDPQVTVAAEGNEATLQIADDEVPLVGIVRTSDGDEDGPLNGMFTVSQPFATQSATVIGYSVGGTATSGSDFNALSGTVTIEAGETSAVILVPVLNDDVVEGEEIVTVTLTSIDAGISELMIDAANQQASLSILDNDAAQVRIAGTTDGQEAGEVAGLLTVTQTAVSSTDTEISFTVAGTAAPNDDYGVLSGSVTIPAGETIATIPVSVLDDSLVEADETIVVTLGQVTNGNDEIAVDANNHTGSIAIIDDDTALVGIVATRFGDETGPVDGQFTVNQTAVSSVDTVVSYTVAGTATENDDYETLSGTVTIPAGETSAPIDVLVQDDDDVEGAETVIVTLIEIMSGDSQITIDPAAAEAAIEIADDETPRVSIVTTTGGDEAGTVAGLFTVSQTIATATDTVISYSVSGTASSGADFTALEGTVVIEAGLTTATIQVPVVDDGVVEGAETVAVALISIVSGDPQLVIHAQLNEAALTIADDDSAQVSIVATSGGDESGPSSGTFTVTQSAVSSTDTVVDYNVSGTATSGDDYAALFGSVTIPAGETSAPIEVIVVDDPLVEADETVVVSLLSIASGHFAITIDEGAMEASLEIADDDSAEVSISVAMHGGEDGPTNGRLTVTQTAPSSADTVISYTVTGTATPDEDYQALSGMITIFAGDTSAAIDLLVNDDDDVEGRETVVVTIDMITSDPQVTINQDADQATLDIIDDESPRVSITRSGNGSEDGPIAGLLTVSQNMISDTDTVVSYSIGGTATAGEDYEALPGTVVIEAGNMSATIPVTVLDDHRVEGMETVTITLTSITNGDPRLEIDPAQDRDTVEIADDESGLVEIATFADGSETGEVGGQFVVSQDGVTLVDTVVNYTVSGTAAAGDDYTALSGSVTIPAGETSAIIDVAVLDDAIVEGAETINVTLTVIAGGDPLLEIDSLSDTATLEIADDDSAVVSIGRTADGGEQGPTTGIFTASQSAVSSTDTVISYFVSGTAATGDDFIAISGTVTIAAGETTATIEVAPIDDPLVEANETVTVSLNEITSGNAAVTIASENDSATLEIADNDSALVSISKASDGDEQGEVAGDFIVTLSAASSTATIIEYSVGGTAAAGEDYTPLGGMITVPAGETSATIGIGVIDDSRFEGPESVIVTLTRIASGDPQITIDTTQDEATVDIADDETGRIGIARVVDGGETGPVSGQFVVTQDGITGVDTVITYTVTGSATSGSDFASPSGVVTILAGETSATIDVPVLDDSVIEGAETVGVQLTQIVSGDSSLVIDTANDEASLEIADNDSALVSIAASSNGSETGPTAGRFTVSQGGTAEVDTVISYLVTGAATSGDDFTPLSGTVTIVAGTTSAIIEVPVIDDGVVENTESVTVSLDAITSGAPLIEIDPANDEAAIEISDNDQAQVSVSVETNGNETGPANGVFLLAQSATSSTDTVIVYTMGGTATAGSDYQASSGTATIPAGELTATILVPVIDDNDVEGAETVSLMLTSIISGDPQISLNSAQQTAVMQIADNDAATITFVQDASSVMEAAGVHTLQIRLSIPAGGELERPVAINIVGSGGTAGAADFTLTTTQVTFAAGSAAGETRNISLTLADDGEIEDDETIALGLQIASDGTSGQVSVGSPGSHTVTIIDDPMTGGISGTVWVDANNNGQREAGELPIPGVMVELRGEDRQGQPIELAAMTASDGTYRFMDLPAGTYDIVEQQPAAFMDGMESLGMVDGVEKGTAGEDEFTGIVLQPAEQGVHYDFGEFGVQAQYVSVRFFLASTPQRIEMLRQIVIQAETAEGNEELAEQIQSGSVPSVVSAQSASMQSSGEPSSALLMQVEPEYASREPVDAYQGLSLAAAAEHQPNDLHLIAGDYAEIGLRQADGLAHEASETESYPDDTIVDGVQSIFFADFMPDKASSRLDDALVDLHSAGEAPEQDIDAVFEDEQQWLDSLAGLE